MRQNSVPIDRDALLPGVYNYCDRWCERCRFTSRCGVFMQEQAISAACRPGPTPAASSQPADDQRAFTWDVPEVSEQEIARQLEEAERRTKQAAEDPLCVQAQGYGQLVHEWLAQQPEADLGEPRSAAAAARPPHPEEVIAQFSFYIGAKVYRAVEGALEEGVMDVQSDANGSAKAALFAIQRSQAAWMSLRPKRPAGLRTAVGLLDVLASLRRGLEQRFPMAYAFVRPGFDEPRG
jgi:hypothetical protein